MPKYKNRVKKLIHVRANELIRNPWNFRIHPEKQAQVLREVLGEVGISGAVIVRELGDGKYGLIDGHLRVEEVGEEKIPALVLDLNEEEAKLLLAAYDPISSLAETDPDAFAGLIKDVEVRGQATAALFSELTEGTNVLDEDDLQLDIEEGEGDIDIGVDEEAAPLQMSHVRMVQLYCTASNLEEFETMAAEAGRMYGTTNLTDTIFAVLREVTSKASGKTKKKNSDKQ